MSKLRKFGGDKNKRKGREKGEGKQKVKRGRKRAEREKREKKKGLPLLFKIYENRTLGFRRNKRKSRSTHRELRMGIKILEFRQTPRCREFSYLDYF